MGIYVLSRGSDPNAVFPYSRNKWERSGAYDSEEAALNGAEWWQDEGYDVYVKKQGDSWYHWRRKPE